MRDVPDDEHICNAELPSAVRAATPHARCLRRVAQLRDAMRAITLFEMINRPRCERGDVILMRAFERQRVGAKQHIVVTADAHVTMREFTMMRDAYARVIILSLPAFIAHMQVPRASRTSICCINIEMLRAARSNVRQCLIKTTRCRYALLR